MNQSTRGSQGTIVFCLPLPPELPVSSADWAHPLPVERDEHILTWMTINAILYYRTLHAVYIYTYISVNWLIMQNMSTCCLFGEADVKSSLLGSSFLHTFAPTPLPSAQEQSDCRLRYPQPHPCRKERVPQRSQLANQMFHHRI